MRLLLVEDEIQLSNALATILKHNNYSVDCVYDRQAALDYLEAGIYDAVILDIMLPKIDGITVLRTVRNNNNKVPIIMLTAKSQIEDKVKGLDYGADDYLTKPFNTKELLARIRSITRRQNQVQNDIIAFGDIVLNKLSFELKANDLSLRLSNKEFQMMEMFMLSPNIMISIDKFMDKIWGFDSESEMNVVWTYICYLRKKLKILNSKVKIKAIRNIGYTLEYDTTQGDNND